MRKVNVPPIKSLTILAVGILISDVYVFSAPAQQSTIEPIAQIAFEFFRNEILIQVKIDGKGPFTMMVDTGTDPSAIDLTTSKSIGLRLNGVGNRASGGGTTVNLAYETKLNSVEIESFTAQDVEAVAIDLNKLSERMGRRIDGVLGHSLLNRRVVQIDYPRRSLRFYSSSPVAGNSVQTNTVDLTRLSFKYKSNILIYDVSVNGRRITANVDTGSNGLFQLTPKAVNDLGLQDEASRGRRIVGSGYNGTSDDIEATVENVTIGAISIENPNVVFFGKGSGRDSKPWGINVGNDFLKNYVVTIDYPKKMITLERPHRSDTISPK